MPHTSGWLPRLKTTTTNKKGTASLAVEICFMGSNKFLASKKGKASCSLCLATARGYPFMGTRDSFPRKRGMKTWKDSAWWRAKLRSHCCWQLLLASVSGSVNPPLFRAGGATNGKASNCSGGEVDSHASQHPQVPGPSEAKVVTWRAISFFPDILRH